MSEETTTEETAESADAVTENTEAPKEEAKPKEKEKKKGFLGFGGGKEKSEKKKDKKKPKEDAVPSKPPVDIVFQPSDGWSQDDIARLKDMAGRGYKESGIASRLGKGPSVVRKKAKELGIKVER